MAWILLKGSFLKELKPVQYPLLFFILALLISIIFSINKTNSLGQLYKYIANILVFIVGVSLSYENKHKIIRVLVLAGFVISILAIYQYLFGFSHITSYVSKKGITNPFVLDCLANKRIFLPFITPNSLAGYLILIVPLILIINDKEKWFVLGVVLLAILLTKSIGGLMALSAGVLFYALISKKFNLKRMLIFISLAAAVIFIFNLRQSLTKEHLHPLFSVARRFDYCTWGLKIIKAHFLTGVGIGNFNSPFSRFAHNSYIQIWAEMGILGIISFLWLIFTIFKSGLQNLKSYPQNKTLGLVLTTAFIFLVHNLIDFTFFLPEIGMIWWLLVGLEY